MRRGFFFGMTIGTQLELYFQVLVSESFIMQLVISIHKWILYSRTELGSWSLKLAGSKDLVSIKNQVCFLKLCWYYHCTRFVRIRFMLLFGQKRQRLLSEKMGFYFYFLKKYLTQYLCFEIIKYHIHVLKLDFKKIKL